MGHHRIELGHQIRIEASAHTIYGLVSDITRTGEWSPECLTARWIDGEPGTVGSRFVGSNYERNADTGQEWRWEMTCEVIEATPPVVFAWSVLTEAWDRATSVWRYLVEPSEGGVLLTHTYRMTRPPKGWQPILDRHNAQQQVELVEARRRRLDNGMRATLQSLRTHAEGSPDQGSAQPAICR